MEECREHRIPMIGEMAPPFHAVTTQGEVDFPKDYSGKWVILFSYEADFTPVCTTELMTFASMINEFKDLDTELFGLSVDSVYSHIAWLRKIKELAWKDLKHVEVTFPLAADTDMEAAEKYGMLFHGDCGAHMERAVYIIDPDGRIRAVLFYPAAIGRNIQEIKRLVIALKKADREMAATPAGWQQGEDIVLLPPKTCGAAADRADKVNENMYSLDWFISFREPNEIPLEEVSELKILPTPYTYPPRRRINNRRM